MTAKKFAKAFLKEKKKLIKLYFNSDEKSAVGELIKDLNLDDKTTERLRQILNGVLTDAFYTILLGIDGVASIGDNQERYKLFDESGNELTGGEIEGEAWDYFHNYKYEREESKSDFMAELKFAAEGGRTNPVTSGYRPIIKFDFDEVQKFAYQQYIDRKLVFPGVKVVAEINILLVDLFAHQLEEGTKFTFSEGLQPSGTGRILAAVNKRLDKQGSESTPIYDYQ